MFHALVCYVCNMFPTLQVLCERLDGIVRHLAWNDWDVSLNSQVSDIAVELEAYMEGRNHIVAPQNFIRVELSETANPP